MNATVIRPYGMSVLTGVVAAALVLGFVSILPDSRNGRDRAR